VLATLLASVTPISFDGETLELAFAPGMTFGVSKVEAKADELREALRDVFGIAPRIHCVVREAAVGAQEPDEEPPVPEEEALALIRAELDAVVEPQPDPERTA
jgi:hypothetical protein